ncbi:B12-binding domain-containing radical SAM protein [bacterium]|nr:B12-binding domain-containing radical SAM protein [bacterium]
MKVFLTRTMNKTPMLIPNLGLGYLATALIRAGHEVTVLDCILEGVDARAFAERLANQSYDLIGFQVYTFDVRYLSAYLEASRRVAPRAVLVAGGPHPTAAPEEMLTEFPQLEAVFCGEAEPGLPLLCERLAELGAAGAPQFPSWSQAGHFEAVPGLVVRDGGGDFIRNQRRFVEDLDATGFPAWDKLKPLAYPPAPQGTFTRRLPVAPIIVTRGCPFDCTFCAGHLIAGKKLRSRSARNVVDEIEFLVREYGIQEIHIEDDNFSLNRKMVSSFCQELLAREIDVSWSCPNGLRLDSLDQELVGLMARAGCYSIALGIESGSQRILDLMKKRLKVTEVTDKINMIRRSSDISITGFFMIGYPGETEAEIRETIRLSRTLDLDKVNFGAFMPLPGSTAFNELKKQGRLHDLDYTRITEYRAAVSFAGLSARRLRMYLQWSFIRFYMRPHIIVRFLRQIKSWYQVRILGQRLLEVFWR